MDEWWHWWGEGGRAFANFNFGLDEHSEFSCVLRTHVRSRTISVAAIENTPSLNAAENINKTNDCVQILQSISVKISDNEAISCKTLGAVTS